MQIILKKINEKLPQIIWGVKRVRGSILIIDCGEKVSLGVFRDRERYCGSFSLTFYMTNWSLMINKKLLLDSNCVSNEKYNRVGEVIIGKKVLAIEENIPRRKLMVYLSENFNFVLTENIRYYGYNEDMLQGSCDERWWGYSPHKCFYWER